MKKNIKLIIILASVLIVITPIVILTTRYKKKQIELPRVKLFSIENEDAAGKFELNYGGQKIIAEKNADGFWQVVTPELFPGDQMECLANVKNFNTLIFDTKITNMTDRSVFGVDQPKEEFSVWEGEKKHTIYVGNMTLDQMGYYVKYNDEVFKIEDIYIMALQKSVLDLRDKDFLKIGLEEIAFLNINNKIKLQKQSRTNWSANGDETVDQYKLYKTLTTLALVKAHDFGLKDIDKTMFQFPKTAVKITISLDDKSTVSYSMAKINDNVYAKVGNEIYQLDPSIYDEANHDMKYYKEPIKNEEMQNKFPEDMIPIEQPE